MTRDAIFAALAVSLVACPWRGQLALAGMAFLFLRRMDQLDAETRPHGDGR